MSIGSTFHSFADHFRGSIREIEQGADR